jgi:pSer/pThr/pTyr-binding forkhead associated (FHA) protein
MLIITMDSEAPTEHLLPDGELTIGRADGNDIILRDIYASRQHAHIKKEGETYVWADREVTRPTTINGTAVSGPTTLQDGDTIEVGETTLVFRQGSPRG